MIFEMDLTQHMKSKLLEETSVPCAPPPSPSFNSRRKPMNISVHLSKLVDSCEDLIAKTSRISLGSCRSSPLHMKRKTSDSEDCYSSESSPGISEISCSVGKRSRSSLNLDSIVLNKSSGSENFFIKQ